MNNADNNNTSASATQKTASDLAAKLKETDFIEELLNGYISQGFGQMPARQMQLLILELLTKKISDWERNPPVWDMSRKLRISPKRLRGLLDDIAYMDTEKTDDWCAAELKKILTEDHEKVANGKAIRVQVDDGLVRDYAISQVRKRFGLVEFGMNSSIIELSSEKFAMLAISLLEEEEAATLIESIDQINKDTPKDRAAYKLFIDEFAKASGKEAGTKLTKLALAVLTLGATEAIDFVNGVLKKGEAKKGIAQEDDAANGEWA